VPQSDTIDVRFVHFRSTAGFVVRGGRRFDKPLDVDLHMQRAAWLTAQTEAASWGTVQSYDGVGMSCGVIHMIAVNRGHDGQPATQGAPFWRLVRACLDATADVGGLQVLLDEIGWTLGPDGVVVGPRTIAAAGGGALGPVVTGEALRTELSGPKGVTPESGPKHERARDYAIACNALMRDPRTFRVQVDAAIRWLVLGHAAEERAMYGRFAQPAASTPDLATLRSDVLPPAADLAMCVYHSFSVNAPSEALRQARQSLAFSTAHHDPIAVARSLCVALGTDHYARWPTRYEHIRRVARGCGLWAPELVDRVMPRLQGVGA